MVAMLGGTATATTEPGFQLTQAACAGHSFATLLAGETAHGIAAPDIPAGHDGCSDTQHDGGQTRQDSCGDDSVEQTPQHVRGGGRPGSGKWFCLSHQSRHHRDGEPHQHH